MKIVRFAIALSALTQLLGCATTPPTSQAERLSGYTYIPVDPFSVRTNPGNACEEADAATLAKRVDVKDVIYKDLLEALPDNAVRVSIQRYSSTGEVSYGVGSVSGDVDSYKLTVDYINSDTVNEKFWLGKFAERSDSSEVVPVNLSESIDKDKYVDGSLSYDIRRITDPASPKPGAKYEQVNLPVYVGVGLRVTASIESSKGAATITGLGSLAARAEASNLDGFLVTQTLGINGQGVAGALPIQSELNPTTAQNAIVAVGSIKALLYEEGTIVAPRVVGLYLPFPGGEPLVNAIVSELSKEQVVWERPCIPEIDKSGA